MQERLGQQLGTTNGWILCIASGTRIASPAFLSHRFRRVFGNGASGADIVFSSADAETIYRSAQNSVATLPKNQSVKILITQAVESLNAVYDSLQIMRNEMYRLASLLPEFGVVMAMEGAGPITGPQLMAEIGDVRRFTHKGALVAFAGVDAPPFQSGTFDAKSRHVSKKGSPHLRKVLFEAVSMIFMHGNLENPIYCFMDKKRSEGKHYYVYTVAGAAKFLRITTPG